MNAFVRHAADERIREEQQGLGKPINSVKLSEQQIVVVGNTEIRSPKWKTFPDFLSDYIKKILWHLLRATPPS